MAMWKVDAKAEQKRNNRSGLAADVPQENTEDLLTTTMLPLTSRWPQMPASIAILMGKHRADSPTKVKPSKPKRGSKRQIKIIKKKRKGRNKGGKGERKITKQPVLNHTTSFTTSSYK